MRKSGIFGIAFVCVIVGSILSSSTTGIINVLVAKTSNNPSEVFWDISSSNEKLALTSASETIRDPTGDVSAGFIDIVEASATQSGNNLIFKIKLRELPSKLYFDKSDTPVNRCEYEWGVYIDTDEDNSSGSAVFKGSELCVSATHFKSADSNPQYVSIVDGTQKDVWLYEPQTGCWQSMRRDVQFNADLPTTTLTLVTPAYDLSLSSSYLHFVAGYYHDGKIEEDWASTQSGEEIIAPTPKEDVISVPTSEWQRNIKATREGTTAENQSLNPVTAYGFSTDTDLFVALPCKGLKGKEVELVILQSGISVTAPVGDIGPWYIDDCYWTSNSRPRAETQARTNKAGIDISQALWVSLGLNPRSGEVMVDWRFVDTPLRDTQRYSLSTSVSPSNAGSINPSSGTYDKNELIKLAALENSGWGFERWGGDASGTSTTTTITMDCNKSVTAYFVRSTPTTLYNKNGWHWPAGRENTVTDIGWLDTRYWAGRDHLGHDFLGNAGDPAYAVSHGKVVLSNAQVGGYGPEGGPGGALVIMHCTAEGRTFYALYGHLDNLIPEGREVEAGTIVGRLNHYSPSHLHFGIRPDELDPEKPFRGFTTPRGGTTYGWVDPIAFLNNNQPSQPATDQRTDQPPPASAPPVETPQFILAMLQEIINRIRNLFGFK